MLPKVTSSQASIEKFFQKAAMEKKFSKVTSSQALTEKKLSKSY